jgi:hypothetical protein
VGASYGGVGDVSNWGNLVVVLDPARLAGRGPTALGVAQLTARLHGLRRVRVPPSMVGLHTGPA